MGIIIDDKCFNDLEVYWKLIIVENGMGNIGKNINLEMVYGIDVFFFFNRKFKVFILFIFGIILVGKWSD